MKVVRELDLLANLVVIRQLNPVHDAAHGADDEPLLLRTDREARDAHAVVAGRRDHLDEVVLGREDPRVALCAAHHRRRVQVHAPVVGPAPFIDRASDPVQSIPQAATAVPAGQEVLRRVHTSKPRLAVLRDEPQVLVVQQRPAARRGRRLAACRVCPRLHRFFSPLLFAPLHRRNAHHRLAPSLALLVHRSPSRGRHRSIAAGRSPPCWPFSIFFLMLPLVLVRFSFPSGGRNAETSGILARCSQKQRRLHRYATVFWCAGRFLYSYDYHWPKTHINTFLTNDKREEGQQATP
jgi:hypothetical protein